MDINKVELVGEVTYVLAKEKFAKVSMKTMDGGYSAFHECLSFDYGVINFLHDNKIEKGARLSIEGSLMGTKDSAKGEDGRYSDRLDENGSVIYKTVIKIAEIKLEGQSDSYVDDSEIPF